MQPSRKDTIIIYTVLGWALCGIFSIVAYSMANADLQMMDAGLMDERDRDSVKLMKTVGLVHMIIMGCGLGLVCCSFMLQLGTARY